MSKPLALFNKSLYVCKLHEKWKSAIIIPLFKKGDSNISSNYKPIVLLTVCKVMEINNFKYQCFNRKISIRVERMGRPISYPLRCNSSRGGKKLTRGELTGGKPGCYTGQLVSNIIISGPLRSCMG